MGDQTLYLLRHGESVANAQRVFASRVIDPPLTETGMEQIGKQADSLRGVSLDAIYCSTLLRARQTAEIMSLRRGLEIRYTNDLREIDLGVLDGQSYDDRARWALYESVVDAWDRGNIDSRFPEGESLRDVRDRLRRFLGGLGNQEGANILVVGHCLLFMVAIWSFCANPGPRLGDGRMGRGHLSILSKEKGKLLLLAFNIAPGGDIRRKPVSGRHPQIAR